MSEHDILAQVLARLTGIEGAIAQGRAETTTLIEGVHTALDGIREDLAVLGGADDRIRQAGQNTRDEARAIADSLAAIERLLLKHGTRLDNLERRLPPA
jgi:3-oxoacyl-(acyl-carrier-protein) synthase